MSWFSRILGREGDVKWKKEFLELEAFFSRISEVLDDFATTYNLMIVKYSHSGPDWTFRFRHPKGGLGQIFVVKQDEEHIGVVSAWDVDDYDTLTRYSKYTEIKKCSLEKPTLLALLDETFKLVLSWQKEDLTPGKHKYNEWKKHPKEMIEGDVLKYPIPKID